MYLCSYCKPSNDENNLYIFTDFIFTCGCNPVKYSDFRPEYTEYRTNQEEFKNLINLILKGCNYFVDIQISKAIWCLTLVLFELMLFFGGKQLLSKEGIVLSVVGCIFFYVIQAMFIWLRMKKHEIKIREILRIENSLKYGSRGLYWDVGPSCKFLHLKLDYNSGNMPLLSHDNIQMEMPPLVLNMDINIGGLENSTSKSINKFLSLMSLFSVVSVIIACTHIIMLRANYF